MKRLFPVPQLYVKVFSNLQFIYSVPIKGQICKLGQFLYWFGFLSLIEKSKRTKVHQYKSLNNWLNGSGAGTRRQTQNQTKLTWLVVTHFGFLVFFTCSSVSHWDKREGMKTHMQQKRERWQNYCMGFILLVFF